MLGSNLAQRLSGGVRGYFNAHSLRQSGVDTQPRPLAAQVDRAVLGLNRGNPELLCARNDNLLHTFGHHILIGVGFVAFQGCKFRAVRRIHALVAEYATNFVDALNTAHHGTLKRQLGGDAHRHRLVEGIQVGAERASRRAAMHQLQHRGFQLNIAMIFQHTTHSAGNQSALFHQVTSLGANHQVQVAAAHPSFLVQILVQHGHGAN